jgi:hypothetical protein
MIDSETLQMWQLVREPTMSTRPAAEVMPPRVDSLLREVRTGPAKA